jgi:hypothetical protein
MQVVIFISAMKSAEVSTAFRSNQPFTFQWRSFPKPERAMSVMSADHSGMTDGGIQEQLAKKFLIQGIEVSSEELGELESFREFMSRHIKSTMICDVQCMLLWSEWVRFHKKRTRKIPDLILEKEFRDIIINKFEITVTEDGFRGCVYPGIKFVP